MDYETGFEASGPRQGGRVVVIGGGFTGVALAIHLLEHPGSTSSIIVIEPRAILGAGLAYSTSDLSHRVNVPAARLLVVPSEPGAFHDWLEQSGALHEDPAAQIEDGRRYPRRSVFGRYVNQRLAQALDAPGAPEFEHIRAQALGLTRQGHGFEVVLNDGSKLEADKVVLAVSHPPPGILAVLRPLAGAEKFIADPWAAEWTRKVAVRDRVLIIGTALSTADCIASLYAAGHKGSILAISRRGLVSRARRVAQDGPFGDFSTAPATTVLELLKNVRQAVAKAPCWESVIEAVRNQGQAIWAALPVAERQRFLRHLRPYWDVHRYQLAPQPGAIQSQKIQDGLLKIAAARIVEARLEDGKFGVTLRRKSSEWQEVFDVVINCTGPDHAGLTETHPLLSVLAKAGLVQADVHALGLDTDRACHAIGADGTPVFGLFVAGPLARGTFGELMGLPQVTEHAVLVAEQILAQQAMVQL